MSPPTVEEALARLTAALDAAPGVLSIIRIGKAYRGKLDVGHQGAVTAEGESVAAVIVRLGYLCDLPD